MEKGAAFLFGLEEQGMMESPQYESWFKSWEALLKEYMATGDDLATVQQQVLI